jgi:hypothetical protein
MSAAKHTGILGKRGGDVLNDLSCANGLGLFVRDVHVLAAGQPHAQQIDAMAAHPRRLTCLDGIAAAAVHPPACAAGVSRFTRRPSA